VDEFASTFKTNIKTFILTCNWNVKTNVTWPTQYSSVFYFPFLFLFCKNAGVISLTPVATLFPYCNRNSSVNFAPIRIVLIYRKYSVIYVITEYAFSLDKHDRVQIDSPFVRSRRVFGCWSHDHRLGIPAPPSLYPNHWEINRSCYMLDY